MNHFLYRLKMYSIEQLIEGNWVLQYYYKGDFRVALLDGSIRCAPDFRVKRITHEKDFKGGYACWCDIPGSEVDWIE